ncbi:hypothetical protein ACN42_g7483 [Penicillium freii]|uniref:Uncharacterized protein n=1 Tax=Penicillium freii TaxID=48697 RepID=A0A117NMQ6_PENFR|nr:hypothetical protein ACN42_g7483 [Penicillium freii]
MFNSGNVIYQMNCNTFMNFGCVRYMLIYEVSVAAVDPIISTNTSLYEHSSSVYCIYFWITEYWMTCCMSMTISLLKQCRSLFVTQQSHVMFQPSYLFGSSCLCMSSDLLTTLY